MTNHCKEKKYYFFAKIIQFLKVDNVLLENDLCQDYNVK